MRDSIRNLTRRWQSFISDESSPVSMSVQDCLIAAQEFLKYGEPLLATEILYKALHPWREKLKPTFVMLLNHKQCFETLALALAEIGALSRAIEILELLEISMENVSPETKGILARCYKQRGIGQKGDQRAVTLAKAIAIYEEGYEQAMAQDDVAGAYYNGINVASLSLLVNKIEQAHETAEAVRRLCLSLVEPEQTLAKSHRADAWLTATIAESYLVLGKLASAYFYYEQAGELLANDIRARMSMFKQAKLLMHALELDPLPLYEALNPPVVWLLGKTSLPHSLSTPDYGPKKKDHLYAAITDAESVALAYEAQLIGCTLHFYLPCHASEENLLAQKLGLSKNCSKQLREIIRNADYVTEVASFDLATWQNLAWFTGQFMQGDALAKAEAIQAEVKVVGAPLAADSCSKAAMNEIVLDEGAHSACLFFLFADMKGYSKLKDSKLICFTKIFLDIIKIVLEPYSRNIVRKRTQGDGLFLVANSLTVAAECALRLRDRLIGFDWSALGLPADLSVRISLDCGPAYSFFDEVVNLTDVCGHYVNRAARLEPITPPGHIYVSDSFVAMANLKNGNDFDFTYCGKEVLPKGSGLASVYLLNEQE